VKILLLILTLILVISSCSEPKEPKELVSPYVEPENGCYSETSRAINISQNKPSKPDFTYDRFCIKDKIADDKNQLFLSCEKSYIDFMSNSAPTFIIFTADDMKMETFNFIITEEEKEILLTKPEELRLSCPNEACTSYEIWPTSRATLDRATLTFRQVRNKLKYNEITGRWYESLDTETLFSSCAMHDKRDFIEHIDNTNQAVVKGEIEELEKQFRLRIHREIIEKEKLEWVNKSKELLL
tara:strand:+ start:126 stop:848 length:723 start_codon:yes stop_codon:yes gene_type:complete